MYRTWSSFPYRSTPSRSFSLLRGCKHSLRPQGLAMRGQARIVAARWRWRAASSWALCCRLLFVQHRNWSVRETWLGSTFPLARGCCLSWSEMGRQLATAHLVASDKLSCIRQTSFRGSAFVPFLFLLPPFAVYLPHSSVPDVPLQALGVELRNRMCCN